VIATVFYARKAWKEAEATNKQTREQFAAERRAWCSVEVQGPNIDVAGDFVEGLAQIVVKNVGQTPAQRVDFFKLSWTPSPDEKGLADAMERARLEPPPVGMTLFPGQSNRYPATWRYDGTALSLGTKRAFLQGWVSYWTAGDNRRHFTPFMVEYSCEVSQPHVVIKKVATPLRLALPAD
jgi:hypothetical protein